ncbi:MAG: hypothetical protein D6708_06180, partial [Candidatus Dadabacteria bacterium]
MARRRPTTWLLLAALAVAWGTAVPGTAGWEDARRAIRAREYDRALALLRRGAAQGDPEAQYLLGGMYRNGMGVGRDPAEAVRWFAAAARRGFEPAARVLGRWVASGGLQGPDLEARRWVAAAAADGDRPAAQRLASWYRAQTPEPRREPPNDRPGGPDALAAAALRGDLNEVRRIAALGVSPDVPGINGRPALLDAVVGGHGEVVRWLLSAGANPGARDLGGNTAVHLAVVHGRAEILSVLLEAGAP